ncbi:MAG: hypothetical protein N3G80_04520 [Candidatus Micrarchaeota archaeon]|nr:hypothetical protein [Candidatus Micrarchaeota archaeon]
MRTLAIFLLLISLSSSFICPTAQRTIYVAAVTGESSGGLFQLEVKIRPGSGLVYTGVIPRTGYTTQESELAAVQYAFASAGADLKSCDVFFTLKGNFGQNTVDGPSAGAAMAIATKAALTNKTIRQDVAVTGTILPSGRIGEVGGVIEKAIASAESNIRYLVVPKLKVYEAFLISSISQKYNFAALEVETIQQAEEIVFSDYSQNFSFRFAPQSKPLPAILPERLHDADTARFSLVAKKVVDRLEASVLYANVKDPALAKYFSDEISKYRKLLSLGYPFSAANSAFLLSVDVEYAKLSDRQLDINGSFESVQECINFLDAPQKTMQNLHWAAASDLRKIWAQKKLNETAAMRNGYGGYVILRDLLFAHNWCSVSSELAGQAKEIGGEPINESILADLASKKLAQANMLFSSSSRSDADALWHYEAGLLANKSGLYTAAIYEAAYAISMQESALAQPEEIEEEIQKMLQENRTSLWGKVYFGQALYLYFDAKDKNLSLQDAYRVMRYSVELDDAAQQIQNELQKVQQEQPVVQKRLPPQQKEESLFVIAFYLGSLGAVSAVAVLRVLGVRI